MTSDEIKQLLALAERATPGPWRAMCDTWVVHGEFGDMVAEADEFNDAAYLAALSPERVRALCEELLRRRAGDSAVDFATELLGFDGCYETCDAFGQARTAREFLRCARGQPFDRSELVDFDREITDPLRNAGLL